MGTILPSRLRSPFEHTGEAKVALFPRLPLLAKGSCLPQQTEGFPLRGTLWAFFAPECPFGAFRCSAWLFQFRQRTALSKLKRSCSRFASLTLRCRTEPALRAAPVFRSAYFPIPHRPTFGAPVFRSAYSASRNARASAAFAASIEAHCAVCRETLMLQVRCARPAPSHRNDPLGRSGVTVGLFSAKSTQYSLLQNARPSGSLREPYG